MKFIVDENVSLTEEESAIVGKFIRSANFEEIHGKLVTLYRSETKIRPS